MHFKMKYALLIVYEYSNPFLRMTLSGGNADIKRMIKLCKHFNISDITLLTDINITIPNIKLKYSKNPNIEYFVREISQFVENTIRGISDTYKWDDEPDEILFYFSGHGAQINNGEGIVLTTDDGLYKRYLVSEDLFNILFGKFEVTDNGYMNVPIWKKIMAINGEIISEYEYVKCKLSPISSCIITPPCSNEQQRSSYLSNRGIPSSSRLLIIIDACHSAQMTSFPYLLKGYTFEKIKKYEDLPFCLCLSACHENKKTITTKNGSISTSHIKHTLSNCNDKLTIGQLYHLLKETSPKYYYTLPIITCTNNDIYDMVPFLSSYTEKEIIEIIK